MEELGLGRGRGDAERVVLVRMGREGPRELEVRWRAEMVGQYSEGRGRL